MRSQSRYASTQQAECQYALSTAGTVPSSSDAAWNTFIVAQRTQKVAAQRLPGGGRVWMRARSLPGALDIPQQPSTWAYAINYMDLAALAAPSGLATSSVTSRSANYTFATTDASLPTAAFLASPSTAPMLRVATLMPGSLGGTVGLLPNSSYQLTVQAFDNFGGVSASTAVIFSSLTTAASGPTAPTLPNLQILVGG